MSVYGESCVLDLFWLVLTFSISFLAIPAWFPTQCTYGRTLSISVWSPSLFDPSGCPLVASTGKSGGFSFVQVVLMFSVAFADLFASVSVLGMSECPLDSLGQFTCSMAAFHASASPFKLLDSLLRYTAHSPSSSSPYAIGLFSFAFLLC